ncbi:50S ribosomal protein L3 [Neoehrlichia mikurensis]|uniref:Large ribosomal subunit protein uL3 n=1 Tax=Neoehrlichia mikurensis TaxID=89586 RepID=A0A9Q9F3Q6_9RICK|nr:50S ribosomal protein L3 [Neoehrlichia mikurensis]QXK91791.1 50S ribosomal protein L3 [Neoehrlichia mikurensis]QXK93004.1 50S ribosomal protein L3 [Neoehrlichia mikurensis]QXK93481.1 50S ribosomal protein L3 [Neoehrlichia mikurensis]UTO55564.1 50S ribosomal protein L3 [Neoehrlichia mikurensis]UTO56485.1 50S ribosomal protein L3 [Neoehrlichia mikurensis]
MAKRVGLLMKKVGVTAIFNSEGKRVPVTLLYLDDSYIVELKNDKTHGYNAVVLGVASSVRINKPQVKYLEKNNINVNCKLFESRVDSLENIQQGSKIFVNHFMKGQYVDITGNSIGKGFAGVMKRHNFKGLRASHGVSISHRSAGSTGQCQDPGRVFKGKKMAGRLGNTKVTIQNIEVLDVNCEKSLLIVKGNSIPGVVNSYVFVKDAVKYHALSNAVS